MDLILGHNQFIGVSHISEKKSQEYKHIFSDVSKIYDIAEAAFDIGYKNMVIETHPTLLDFIRYYEKMGTIDMGFYLQVPYVHGYIQKINEIGLPELINELMRSCGVKKSISLAFKNTINLARRDYLSFAINALNLELSPFNEVNIKKVFLHNIVTDLLLALGIKEPFMEYTSFVKEEFGADPGFITLNFSLLKENFKELDMPFPQVMTPINPGGFDMNPSKEIVESDIRTYDGKIIAMNILGGGAFSISDSVKYIKTYDCISSCIIGSSSPKHLKEAKEKFNELI